MLTGVNPRTIDHDHPVTDRVHLESLPGVVDRLLQQCHDLGAPLMTAISRVADSVVLDYTGPLAPVAALRVYSAFSVLLGDHADSQADAHRPALAALRASRDTGVLSALPAGPLRFRIDPIAARWELRDLLESELGWVNDPRDYQLNLTRRDALLLAQVGPLYYTGRFPALRKIPASTTPLIAAVMLALAKPRPGNTVYDPFCGAGTLLAEAAAQDVPLTVLGTELDPRHLAESVGNHAVFPAVWLGRADAAHLPVADGAVDRVVSNLPFGKRVGSHAGNTTLYPAFLAELGRVLRADGRAVLLTEDKQLFKRTVEAARGLRVLREVPLASGGLHPTAYVLERTRTAKRTPTPHRRRPTTTSRSPR
jgi:tRNA (guanine6-N2)-methyltransferase